MSPSNKENEAPRVLGGVACKVDLSEMNSQAMLGLGLLAICWERVLGIAEESVCPCPLSGRCGI